jgi:NAD(P)-dependent dehydrogenase (short-subunit alcohol dehydrogenase family)
MAHDAFGLDGSVAVVTGGSRGIGEATAVALAEAGADVAPVARSEDELAETATRVEDAGSEVHPVVLDVTDSAGIVALFDEVADALGPADVLVNNAGTNPFFGDARDLDTGTWEQIFAVNVRGAFECAREFGSRALDRDGEGALVNVASVGGVRGLPRQVPYVASKHALVGMTKTLAVDWAPEVRVNALAPGYVKTDLTEGVRENESIREDLLSEIPQDRFADPEEVATGAVYLASDAASYVTGEVHLADGGMSAN